MNTMTKPISRVRMADSGGITTLTPESLVKPSVVGSDTAEACLPNGPYRIVMYCRNSDAVNKPAHKTVSKR